VVALLYLIRHGETDWNRELRWQGHADPPLNAHGLSQAEAAARALADAGLVAVYSSDLTRARQTALPLAQAIGVTPVQLGSWREVDTGSFTGLTQQEVQERFPAAAARHAAGETGWQGGETYADLTMRAVAAAADLAGRYGQDDRVGVVTHGGVIRSLVAHVFGASWRASRQAVSGASHVALTILRVPAPPGHWQMHVFNQPLAPAAPAADVA
jgi:broad specificity phosphatase PhoE